MKIPIIFENEDIVAFNKPSGLLTIPDRFLQELPSLSKEAEKQYGQQLFVVHRLDRPTSGVIIFAKNEEAHKYYSLAFQNRNVKKFYQALTYGSPTKAEDDLTGYIMEHPTIKGKMVVNRRGKRAHTHYKILKTWPGYSLLEVEIFTGRTHQIRVHLSNLGTPIIGDDLYGSDKMLYLSDFKKKFNHPGKYTEEHPLMGRLALHSYELILTDKNGEEITITAPLPKDFTASINQLEKWL